MKKSFRQSAAAIAAVILTVSLAGCSSEESTSAPAANTTAAPAETTTTEATEPKQLDEEDAKIVEEIDLGEETQESVGTVKWLSFWDLNPEKGKPKSVEMELFETKYGGNIKYIPTTYETRFSDLSTYVLGGSSPDLFSAADLDTFPGKVVSGMFIPFDDYLDFDSDLWSTGAKKLSDRHMLGGKHYVSVVSTDAGCVCIYNKRVMEENGFADPAEMFRQGKWDWDFFKKLCGEFSDPDAGKYGFDGWWFEPSLLLTTGVPVIDVQDSRVVSNIGSVQIERAENFMLDMKRNNIPLPKEEFDWVEQPNRVGEGLTLFYPCGVWALYETDLSKFGKEGEVMFVPMPKDPNADEYYLPSGVDAYALCKGAPNPEGAAAFIKCKLTAAKDESALAIADKQYREDYGWTDEMVEMLHTTRELTDQNPVVDFYAGCSQAVYNNVHDSIKSASYNGTDWAVTKSEISDPVQSELDMLNTQIKQLF